MLSVRESMFFSAFYSFLSMISRMMIKVACAYS